ncbi:hypothetical protein ACJIZ3_023451 [Penstemon smallii]|uniref:Cytochrome P450 n=1 Tax=Penstemon smallii TaxID=265156 RepID=A0ABD3TQ58_9LAMI
MMLLLLLFLVPLLLLCKNKFFIRVSKLPPGPNLLQFLWNISQFGKEPHIAFKKLAKIYGPLISIRLGGQFMVIASSPAIAKEILRTNDKILSGRYMPSTYYAIPRVIKSSMTMSKECNTTWKFLRGVSQHFIFSSRAVDSKGEIRKDKVTQMLNYLAEKECQVVKLDDIVTATVSNIVTSVLASRNLYDIRSGEGHEIKHDQKVKALINEIVEAVASPGLTDLFPILRSVDFWSKRNAMVLHRKVMYVWKDIIDERRSIRHENNRNISTRDFLDVLLENAFLDDQISLLFTELLIAGTDSTIITIIWLMVELIRNQEILHKVRHEIKQAFEGNTINESVLSGSKYFQACIKETLRLHIPGPFLVPHRAIEKCKIDNYIIPKDSMILVNAWAIQVDPNNWKEALVFKPERFLDSKIDFRGTHFEFIPFSAGQRMCPGFNMGFRNIQLVVACLVHYFDWSLPNGLAPNKLDTNDKFVTTLKREKPLCLIPTPRKKW